jgi:nucleotide-binding universal stress UspA family protein
MPFLEGAARVVVVAVGEVALDGVIAYLQRHDIAASARHLEKPAHSMLDDPAGDLILGACAAEDADLLVMGAYTHGRLRRMIMGGATRKVLSSTPIPVLMAH